MKLECCICSKPIYGESFDDVDTVTCEECW